MKKLLVIFFLFSVGITINANAQTDTTYHLIRKGEDAGFVFRKTASTGKAGNSQYAMNSKQFKRMVLLLEQFVAMEANYELLKAIHEEKDSIHASRESAFRDALKNQDLRAGNFQISYEKVLDVNQKLDQTLKNCEDIVRTQTKRNKRKIILTGFVSILAGFFTGAAAL